MAVDDSSGFSLQANVAPANIVVVAKTIAQPTTQAHNDDDEV